MRAPYPVTLTQVDDGTIIAQVGCKTITYTTADAVLRALADYFKNPERTIREYSDSFNWNLNQPTAVPGAVTALGYSGGAAVGGRY